MSPAPPLHPHNMITGGGRLSDANQQEPSTAPRVLSILSQVLEKLVSRNEQVQGGGKSNALSAFYGVRAPAISLDKYMERINKYTSCSPSCFVLGFVYIDRLLHKYPDTLLVSLNVHRLLVTSVMVASKILDDVHYNNAFYVRVGGVSNTELNKLELELLFRLDFSVTVSSGVFESYCQHLEKQLLILCNAVERPISPLTLITNDDDVIEISVQEEEDHTHADIPRPHSPAT